MNAGGMLQECQMGLFRGGRLNEGRCGLRGNHKIIIPPLLTFFFPTHTHTQTIHRSTHKFHWNILRCTTIKGESLRGNLTPSWRVVATSNLYRWFYLLFLQGLMFVSSRLLPAAGSRLKVKCYINKVQGW